MLDTRPLLLHSDFPPVYRATLDTLQVNLGYLCNLSCVHCHVNAGPTRTEQMDAETIELILALVQRKGIRTLDLTGGAPELNPHFRYLVRAARRLGVRVIDRCNLTVLMEPGQEDLGEFLAGQQVEISASLPCYLQDNVEAQRGKGVYDTSIEALRQLNALGYGSELILNLVYNPVGPFLPADQTSLQADYKRELGSRNRGWRQTTAASWPPALAFASTNCSRLPICRSAALVLCCWRRGSTTSICACCATTTALTMSPP